MAQGLRKLGVGNVHWNPWFRRTWQHAPGSRIAGSKPCMLDNHLFLYSPAKPLFVLRTEIDQVAAARGAARTQCLAGLERERMASMVKSVKQVYKR